MVSDSISGHMVEHLVCCVVVDDLPGALTRFRLLFYTTFHKRHFLSVCQFCALCFIHKYYEVISHISRPSSHNSSSYLLLTIQFVLKL